jgi:thiol-disulfide isomerase/thioredoxin
MRRLLGILAALLMLAGCGITAPDSPLSGGDNQKIDVDTPQMRAIKAAAGIETCPKPETKDGGLPAITVRCLGGGRSVNLSTLKGPMILNFWAAYCGPCRQEMPALESFYKQYGSRVPVLGVDYTDVQVLGAMKLAQHTGVTYPLITDPAGHLIGTPVGYTKGTPYFVLLKADGSFSLQVGGLDSEQEVVAMVKTHLGIDL